MQINFALHWPKAWNLKCEIYKQQEIYKNAVSTNCLSLRSQYSPKKSGAEIEALIIEAQRTEIQPSLYRL